MRGPEASAGVRIGTPASVMTDPREQFALALALTAAPKHVRTVSATVKRFLWSKGILQPTDLTAARIQEYLARLLATGRSQKTVANYRSAISTFCDFLRDHGDLTVNPCAAVRLRRPEERLPRYLSEVEVVEALRLAGHHGIWPEVALALATGLRLSEMIRLQWADVDPVRRVLAIRKAKSRRPRIVPLCRQALAALEAQQVVSGTFSYVFPARQTWPGGWRYVDTPRTSNWWRRVLQPLQDALPVFRQGMAPTATGRGWHLFRHTFASRAAQRGVSLYKLAAWLGHSDVRTTQI